MCWSNKEHACGPCNSCQDQLATFQRFITKSKISEGGIWKPATGITLTLKVHIGCFTQRILQQAEFIISALNEHFSSVTLCTTSLLQKANAPWTHHPDFDLGQLSCVTKNEGST
jgi:hypothetical protein